MLISDVLISGVHCISDLDHMDNISGARSNLKWGRNWEAREGCYQLCRFIDGFLAAAHIDTL